MNKVNYPKLNYYRTKVAISKSQESIKRFLVKFGLQGTRFTEYKNSGMIEFILVKSNKEMAFRFQYRLPEQEMHKKQVYRALFHYLKNRFLAIEFGITSIEDEFFQELILKLPNGETSTIKEIVKNQLTQLEYSSELKLPFKKKEGD